MKRLFSFLLISILLLFCSCSSKVEVPNDSETISTDNPFIEIENKLLGTWETSMYGNIFICVFEENGNGHFIGNDNTPMPFTYRIISNNQIEQTMVTKEGINDTSVYNFEFIDDKLIFDGAEYSKK